MLIVSMCIKLGKFKWSRADISVSKYRVITPYKTQCLNSNLKIKIAISSILLQKHLLRCKLTNTQEI